MTKTWKPYLRYMGMNEAAEDDGRSYDHVIMDTYERVGVLLATKEDAQRELFGMLFENIKANDWDLLFWRVYPEVEEIIGFDPKVTGWKGFARFSGRQSSAR